MSLSNEIIGMNIDGSPDDDYRDRDGKVAQSPFKVKSPVQDLTLS